jgi:uncharacterized membrane protein
MVRVKSILVSYLNRPYRLWHLGSWGIVLFAFLLRLWGLGSESAWIDEAYSISLAKHSLVQIIVGTAADQHPPLYYLLLHFWLQLGSSVYYARFFSLIIGVFNVFQALQFGRKLAGVGPALSVGVLLAVSPLHIWYSQEVRMYILLATLITASTSLLWDCLHGKNRWWLYGLTSVLAIYTQYFAFFVLLAHAFLVPIWIWKRREMKVALLWCGTMFIVVLAFLPWLPTALYQSRFHSLYWLGSPGFAAIRDTFLRLIIGDGILILPVWMRWSSLVLLFLLAFGGVIIFNNRVKIDFQSLGFLSAWSLIPFSVISLISLEYPIFQIKQFLIIVFPLLFVIVLICFIFPRPIRYSALILIFLALSANLIYQQVTLTKDDWRGVSAYIQSKSLQGDKLYTNPAASNLAISLYGDLPMPVDGVPEHYDIVKGGWEGKVITPESVDSILASSTAGYKRIWLIEFTPSFWDPAGVVPVWLNTHSYLIADKTYGKIHLRLYEFGER